jgi:hypothetical protein
MVRHEESNLMNESVSEIRFIQAGDFVLQDYFFTSQVVQANPHFDETAEPCDHLLDVDIDVIRSQEDEAVFYIQVGIASPQDLIDEQNTSCSYQFSISAFGRFELNANDGELDLRGKSIEYHAGITGTQVLIGAIRERLADLTGRGPWKKVQMQTVGFAVLSAKVERVLEKKKPAYNEGAH